MTAVRTWVALIAVTLLCACTQRTVINYMTSAEDRAFAYDFVAKMRAADEAGLEALFVPAAWPQSQPQIQRVPQQFPRSAGDTDLIGFHVNREVGGNNRRVAQYVLMTDDGSRWTRTTIVTLSFGGHEQRVTAWSVIGTDSIPDDYRQFLLTERIWPWIQAGAVGLMIALVVALMNRRWRSREYNG